MSTVSAPVQPSVSNWSEGAWIYINRQITHPKYVISNWDADTASAPAPLSRGCIIVSIKYPCFFFPRNLRRNVSFEGRDRQSESVCQLPIKGWGRRAGGTASTQQRSGISLIYTATQAQIQARLRHCLCHCHPSPSSCSCLHCAAHRILPLTQLIPQPLHLSHTFPHTDVPDFIQRLWSTFLDPRFDLF